MNPTDVSVVVVAADETVVYGSTLISVDRAAAAARDAGYTVEVVVAVDGADPATTEFLAQGEFAHWQRWVRDEAGPDPARHAIAAATRGRLVTVLAGGDLVSENWLGRGIAAIDDAQERGAKAIGHPEVTIDFDGNVGLRHHVDQSSELYSPYALYAGDVVDRLSLTPRDALLESPSTGRTTATGGLDEQFVVDSMAGGWSHLVVRETVVFRRRREVPSGLRPVPELTIETVRGLMSAEVDQ